MKHTITKSAGSSVTCVGIVLVFVSILFLTSCGNKKETRTGWTEVIPVDILAVGDDATASERNYVGDIGSEKEANLSFALGGTLTRVNVKNGQYVKQGTLLATVDTTSASSMHKAALATLRQAEDAYRRLEKVHKEGGISDVKWVEMETNLEKARQTELSMRKHLKDCSIRAPFSGVVVCGDRYEGQELKPMEVFARLLDMTKLRVIFSVPEQEIGLLAIGNKATATVPALNDKTLHLCITDKSLVSNPMGHTYKVFAAVDAADRQDLLPDMVAKVNIAIQRPAASGQEGASRVVVPSNCIQTMPEGNIVWVVENGKAQHRLVTVGDFVKNGVMIVEGLAAGDTVVVKGQQKLYTGAPVRARN